MSSHGPQGAGDSPAGTNDGDSDVPMAVNGAADLSAGSDEEGWDGEEEEEDEDEEFDEEDEDEDDEWVSALCVVASHCVRPLPNVT